MQYLKSQNLNEDANKFFNFVVILIFIFMIFDREYDTFHTKKYQSSTFTTENSVLFMNSDFLYKIVKFARFC